MKTKTQLIASLVLVLAACGDNKVAPDARQRPDTGSGGGFPAAPTLGTQIDRMGRPAINTLLNRGFDPGSTGSAKDAYNANATPATWLAFVPEFAKNLAILDSLDTGFCGNGRCEPNETTGVGTIAPIREPDCGIVNPGVVGTQSACGNQALYNGGQGGSAGSASYQTLGGVLAGDELQLDTSKMMCPLYLAVEFAVATTGPGTNSTCGGRAPNYDVVDFSLSMTSMGTSAFSTDGLFTPKFKDNANRHADLLGPDAFGTPQTFPFLGPPQ